MKRLLIVLILVLTFAVPAYSGVSLTNLTPAKAGFIVNASTADLSGCETLKAAVSGKSIYIEYIFISSGAAITVTIGEGETGSAVTTKRFGPIYMSANSNTSIDLGSRPIRLTAATALTADASGSGNVVIIIRGFIK